MPDARASLWLRWPDEDSGPLWVGVHLNERAGSTVIVGLEVWTEEPGHARTSRGPAADGSADMLPWPPTALVTADLRSVGLGALRRRVEALLPSGGHRPAIYSDDHYARVAGVYQRAVTGGSRSPTADVARAWSVSRSAAAKWVARSRALGHLPPA